MERMPVSKILYRISAPNRVQGCSSWRSCPIRVSPGGSRSAIWHSSPGTPDQGSFVSALVTRIFLAQVAIALAVDERILCLHRGRCAFGSHQTVYREPETSIR